MPAKALDFTTALITGGGGGLGKAMATHLISRGKKVIIAGRTESNLQQTAKDLGSGCAGYYILDTGKTDSIKPFVQRITAEHPELDCIINNAGVQRPLEITKLDADEFCSKADQEIDINVRGPVHLCLHLLPHFKKRQSAVIMNVSSILGFVPFSVINPVYNCTKAGMHMFTVNLRTQIQRAEGMDHVRVIEIAPPAVGTDLHREREDPDDNKPEKNKASLSVERFMEDLVKGWEEDRDLCSAGPGLDVTAKWQEVFGAKYAEMAQ